MPFITGLNRNQACIMALDDMVAYDSEARIIDAYVDSLDLEEMGISRSQAPDLGRPAYDPAILLKLYIYGYRNGIRSSRKLARACEVNIEVKWLVESLTPDFRTIADFRKENAKSLKGVFIEFTKRVMAGMELGFQSVDGTKVRASNAKDNNFTASKLDDRITRLEDKTAQYLRLLDEEDEDDGIVEGKLSREELTRKLEEAEARLARYENYRKRMRWRDVTQISLTDADSRLMKTRGGFDVAYNAQTAVDSNTHMITSINVTNSPTDHGQLLPTLQSLCKDGEILEATADKGYNDSRDMAACLEAGIIPNVILPDGKEVYELELRYVPNDDVDPTSTEASALSDCLHAGKIPDAYKNAIESIEVIKNLTYSDDKKPAQLTPIYGTEEDMRARAKEGFFVRDPERNLVICPACKTLRQKSIKKNGNIRYANKLACKQCQEKKRCIQGKAQWKEIDFNKDTLEKTCRTWSAERQNDPYPTNRGKKRKKREKVIVRLRPKKTITTQRMCLSEHPFGTIKRAMGADHFLLRGMERVTGEFSLMALSYNLARAKNLLGFDALLQAVKG